MNDEILEGKIVGELDFRKTKEGKLGAEFIIEDVKGKRHAASIWTKSCPQDPNSLLVGHFYTFKGWRPDKSFVVKYFTMRGNDETEGKDRTLKESILMEECNLKGDMALPSWFYTEAGERKYRDRKREFRDYMERNDYVLANVDGGKGWIPKQRCVNYADRWWERVHFCTHAMGQKAVVDEYKKFTKKYGKDVSNFNVEAYEERFMPWLVEQAKYFLDNPPVTEENS